MNKTYIMSEFTNDQLIQDLIIKLEILGDTERAESVGDHFLGKWLSQTVSRQL